MVTAAPVVPVEGARQVLRGERHRLAGHSPRLLPPTRQQLTVSTGFLPACTRAKERPPACEGAREQVRKGCGTDLDPLVSAERASRPQSCAIEQTRLTRESVCRQVCAVAQVGHAVADQEQHRRVRLRYLKGGHGQARCARRGIKRSDRSLQSQLCIDLAKRCKGDRLLASTRAFWPRRRP